MHGLGTTNRVFTETILGQLGDLASGQTLNAGDLDRLFALVQGIAPRDETEAMLAAQMVAVHNATMTMARRLNRFDSLSQQDSASNAFNKLARTFAAQVETLKRYRSTGEQSIRVQHVTMNDGGQAIVGNVATGGGGTFENGGQPHEPSNSSEPGPALLGHVETLAPAVPSSSGEGLDCVPMPRGTGRRTAGQS